MTQMDKLQVELEQERQKAKVTLTRQQQELQQQAEKQALQNGARFAGMLLKQVSQDRNWRHDCSTMLLDNLKTLPEACTLCLQMFGAQKIGAYQSNQRLSINS